MRHVVTEDGQMAECLHTGTEGPLIQLNPKGAHGEGTKVRSEDFGGIVHRYSLSDIQERIGQKTEGPLIPKEFGNNTKLFQHYIMVDVINRLHQLDKIIVEITPLQPTTTTSTIIQESSSFAKHHNTSENSNYHSRTVGGRTFSNNGPRGKYNNHSHHHHHNDTSSSQVRDRNRKGNHYNQQANEEWNAMKSTQQPIAKEGFEKSINDVRGALNKITNKNYEIQRDIIMDSIHKCISNEGDDHVKPITDIGQFIFDIASTNKFYGNVYADLYTELVKKFDILSKILDTFVDSFQQHTMQNIQYIDSTVNYDAYCDYTKMNDKRRATVSFLVMLMIRDVLPQSTILEMIAYFQRTTLDYVDKENRINEMDEMTELFSLFVTLGKDKLQDSPEWKEQIVPHIHAISLYKVKEHVSLSSRSLFKYKDLLKLM